MIAILLTSIPCPVYNVLIERIVDIYFVLDVMASSYTIIKTWQNEFHVAVVKVSWLFAQSDAFKNNGFALKDWYLPSTMFFLNFVETSRIPER